MELEQSASKDFKFVISEPLDDHDQNNDVGVGLAQKQQQQVHVTSDESSGEAAVPPRGGKNQIAIFLDEHNGPGIQHIGLHTCNIVDSVRSSKDGCDSVSYYATPDSYYDNVCVYSKNFLKFD